ncbi:GNAT family N-acetyltransferase [Paenibacillus arenosi]|uniref:GNAT family N-acetyltransferase n=1 Tax=Paenibacillus arenosi TaxID=2774142 RepID=A0ABR9B217_9BACL|nr:GNAT family N-acetyltransferase [Paenibacillus arenosi]MBD8499462.1 GNAT family N-acetyltransferase [Paenibacillus arenosi]
MQYRSACSEDEPFLFELYADSRRKEILAWEWDEMTRDAFLQMQWKAQQHSYAVQYPDAQHFIIETKEHIPVGRYILWDSNQHTTLVDLTIHSLYRNQGIGTSILTMLQADAILTSKPIVLSVFEQNFAARRLYERLGFCVTQSTELYATMIWTPHPPIKE